MDARNDVAVALQGRIQEIISHWNNININMENNVTLKPGNVMDEWIDKEDKEERESVVKFITEFDPVDKNKRQRNDGNCQSVMTRSSTISSAGGSDTTGRTGGGTGRLILFANNYADVFAKQESNVYEHDTNDHIAALFAQCPPGTILCTLSKVDASWDKMCKSEFDRVMQDQSSDLSSFYNFDVEEKFFSGDDFSWSEGHER